jgi:hypothetical protein
MLAPTAVHFIDSAVPLPYWKRGNFEDVRRGKHGHARLGLRGVAIWCDFAPAAGVSVMFPFVSLIAILGVPATTGKGNTRVLIAELIFLSLFVIFRNSPLIRLMVKRWKV